MSAVRTSLRLATKLRHWTSPGAGVAAHEAFEESAALLAIEFLVLSRTVFGGWPVAMRRPNVPVWEHMKRLSRYTIKPLIRLGDGRLFWGLHGEPRPANLDWLHFGGLYAGGFPWPQVRKIVAKAKRDLEAGLEDLAHAIVARATAFVEKGVDFKYRFPRKGFEDVGDFDVLAY